MDKLASLRKKIDEIDAEIVKLLGDRAEMVLGVKKAKSENGLSIYSPAREREILDRVLDLGKDSNFPINSLEKIFTEIVSSTRSLIGELKVAHLGDIDSASHFASIKLFGEAVELHSVKDYSDCFKGLSSKIYHHAVFMIEDEKDSVNWQALEQIGASGFYALAEVFLTFHSSKKRFFVIGRREEIGKSIPSRDRSVFLLKNADGQEVSNFLKEVGLDFVSFKSGSNYSLLEFNFCIDSSQFEKIEAILKNNFESSFIGCFPGVLDNIC